MSVLYYWTVLFHSIIHVGGGWDGIAGIAGPVFYKESITNFNIVESVRYSIHCYSFTGYGLPVSIPLFQLMI